MCTIAKVSHLRKITYIHTHWSTLRFFTSKCIPYSMELTNTVSLREAAISKHMQLFPKPELGLSSLLNSSSNYQNHSFRSKEHLIMYTLCWPYWLLKSSFKFSSINIGSYELSECKHAFISWLVSTFLFMLVLHKGCSQLP